MFSTPETSVHVLDKNREASSMVAMAFYYGYYDSMVPMAFFIILLFLWVIAYLHLILSWKSRNLHGNTYGEERYGLATLRSRGAVPRRCHNFGGFLLMPTPFNIERPNSAW